MRPKADARPIRFDGWAWLGLGLMLAGCGDLRESLRPVEPPRASCAAEQGVAPYCRSRLITSMRWDWADGYTQANGSDLWPVAWGADDAVYVFFGDGGGFGGSDTLGRTSFGIARLTGPPPAAWAAPINVYGGYQALHRSSITGKASSITAMGADFYAIASVYGREDEKSGAAPGPSGSPAHVEMAYSRGNAYSWRVANWKFCGATFPRDKDATVPRLAGAFCPQFFVAYGKANAGAPGGFAYLVGTRNAAVLWEDSPSTPSGRNYLARVLPEQVLQHAAYEYFAGLKASGRPLWSSDASRMQPIFSDTSAVSSSLAAAVYLPGLHRYLGVAQGAYLAQTSFYEAPALWGPWSVVSYNDIDPVTGRGGWGHLGKAAGQALGVHPVNAWTGADGASLWMTYSSDGVAPPEADFPPGGTVMDAFNVVRADLELGVASRGPARTP